MMTTDQDLCKLAITKTISYDNEEFLLGLYHSGSDSHYFELVRKKTREIFRAKEEDIAEWLYEKNQSLNFFRAVMDDIKIFPPNDTENRSDWKPICQFGRIDKSYHVCVSLRTAIRDVKIHFDDIYYCFELLRHDSKDQQSELLQMYDASLGVLYNDLKTNYDKKIDDIYGLLAKQVSMLEDILNKPR
jgi:hypothetical protein